MGLLEICPTQRKPQATSAASSTVAARSLAPAGSRGSGWNCQARECFLAWSNQHHRDPPIYLVAPWASASCSTTFSLGSGNHLRETRSHHLDIVLVHSQLVFFRLGPPSKRNPVFSCFPLMFIGFRFVSYIRVGSLHESRCAGFPVLGDGKGDNQNHASLGCVDVRRVVCKRLRLSSARDQLMFGSKHGYEGFTALQIDR